MEKGDQNKIHDLAFSQKAGDPRFATAGQKHIYFWDASQAGFDKRKGIYEGAPMTSFSAVCWDDQGNAYSGGANSKIYCWDGEKRTCSGTIDVHKAGFICAMTYAEGMLFSGAKDGDVHEVDIAGKCSKRKWSFDNLVRAVDYKGGNLLVGLRNGTIMLTPADGGDGKAIMDSHNDGEVWAVDSYGGKIYTAGDDNQVICWDPAKRCKEGGWIVSDENKKAKRGGASTLSKHPASQQSRCVAVGPHHLAVAGNDGTVTIRAHGNYDKNEHTLRDSTEWIEVMAFSPDASMLAVGSHDNTTVIYETAGFTKKGVLKGHSSFIMALDWSKDSQWLRTNCGAYELLFWKSADCKQDPSGRTNTKGVDWATTTTKFCWNTEGIYPKGEDGSHINAVSGSHDGQLIACGDDFGLVTLFRDPARPGARPIAYRGHSEHVVGVHFSEDDCYLWSVGGYDQTLMQWKRE